MAIFKCKMCGGTLEINNETIAVCEYCGTKQTLPKLDVDHKANLLKRGFMALEDSEWAKADDFFEQCLNQNAELAEAYLGKLMAELHIRTKDNLKDSTEPLENRSNYQKIIRFGSQEMAAKISSANQHVLEKIQLEEINRPKKELYDKAVGTLVSFNDDFYELDYRIRAMESAIVKLESIAGFYDAEEKIKEYKPVIEKLHRRKRKVCQYCGGEFIGIFSKSCSKCGKSKDYR